MEVMNEELKNFLKKHMDEEKKEKVTLTNEILKKEKSIKNYQ